MIAEVNSELDVDNMNISTTVSASTSNMAVNMAADIPRWLKSAVTVVKAGTRLALDVYKQHINRY